jgi:aldehyde dehydrogenase (NAD+)
MTEAVAAARAAADNIRVGDPRSGVDIGPVVSKVQYDKIQRLIEQGVSDGATLVAGGPGRPEGIDKGYFVRPTIFADVKNDMAIAREEIFGPVLSILEYKDVEEAIEIANDSPYGLAGYIQGKDPKVIADIAARLRTGQVVINHPPPIRARRSAATSSRAMAANGAIWHSRVSSRSRRCWATRRETRRRSNFPRMNLSRRNSQPVRLKQCRAFIPPVGRSASARPN